ncbi:MAG: phospholipase D-like domain-containing protein [Burkholderiales bacterium]
MGLSRAACLAAAACLVAAACGALPDTDAMIERHAGQAARFETAMRPLSARHSAAIIAELRRKSGTVDLLDKQIALEQAVVGSPLIVGNRVTLLLDGPATYAAMFAAIRGARDHINFETYIIDDDQTGRDFAALLGEARSRGVQVNFIYDSFGAIATPAAFFADLRAAGIAVLEFNPLNPLSVRNGWTPTHRDHRKLLVVDGRTAFLGGINISSVYSSGSGARRAAARAAARPASAPPWRDTHLRIDGPVVGELQKLFLRTWRTQGGGEPQARDYFPVVAPAGPDSVRAVGSSPDDPFSMMYLTLISAIGNAEQQVYLTNAYFVPDPQLLAALAAAARRGVDVRLILPGHSDSATTFHAGRSYYAELLAAGVRIHERGGTLLHAKTAVIDGVWSTVGSTNLDWRSAMDNDEVNAVVISREFGARMQAMFAVDLAASLAIDAEAWERRPLHLRLREWMARAIGRLL